MNAQNWEELLLVGILSESIFVLVTSLSNTPEKPVLSYISFKTYPIIIPVLGHIHESRFCPSSRKTHSISYETRSNILKTTS